MRQTLMVLAFLLATRAFGQTTTSQSVTAAAAASAYAQKDYARCGELYAQLGHDSKNVSLLYNAACCLALAGKTDAAFNALQEAMDDGWANTRQLRFDPDLSSLHHDSRWNRIIAASDANLAKRLGDSNRELWSITEEDQSDRGTQTIDFKAVGERDRVRRKRVAEILAAGQVKTSIDYFNAALVMQHGNYPDEYKEAHDLAMRAVELDPANKDAKWLAAASEDRYLQCIGKPQIYGTQFRKVGDIWTLDPIDEKAVTDEERARWNVPPLAAAKKRAEAMNAH